MMLLTTVVTAPTSDDFTPLSEHNEQTPGSFFAGKPVLHLQAPAARLQITKDDLESQEAIKALVATTDDVAADDQGLIEVQDIDVWVTSRHLTLWSPTTDKGAQISYQAITVHAQVGDAVLLELNLSNSNNVADEDIEHLQLRIAPDELVSPNAADADLHANEHANGGMNGHANPSFQLYMAIGDCQNLNPDPAQDDEDEEGGMGYDETAPGATGWITSENMHEYTDENGNFVMPEGATVIGDEEDEAVNGNGHEAENGDGNEALGEGAGRVRRADEINGLDGANDEETKWQKTG